MFEEASQEVEALAEEYKEVAKELVSSKYASDCQYYESKAILKAALLGNSDAYLETLPLNY